VTLEVPYATHEARSRALHTGVWIFLASETLLFAGLFAVYSGYRASYQAEFTAGIHHNNMAIGTANTVVLIVSSFCVAWAIHLLRAGRPKPCVAWVGATIALGVTFLVLKTIEYSIHYEDGVYFDQRFAPAHASHGTQLFYALYYSMTGLHALHVIAGMLVLGYFAHRVWRLRPAELELGGLYWHMVDVMWIFLWPLLYLTGH